MSAAFWSTTGYDHGRLEILLGSADWRRRNLAERVEVLVRDARERTQRSVQPWKLKVM